MDQDRFQELGERLARVEERLQDLPHIRTSLEKIQDDLGNLKTRVATIAGSIAVVVSTFVAWVKNQLGI